MFEDRCVKRVGRVGEDREKVQEVYDGSKEKREGGERENKKSRMNETLEVNYVDKIAFMNSP